MVLCICRWRECVQLGCAKQRQRGNNPQIRVVSIREIKITNEEDRYSQSSWNRGSESKCFLFDMWLLSTV